MSPHTKGGCTISHYPLGPYLKSKKGNCYVLATMDAFTNYVMVRAVPDSKAKHVIKALSGLVEIFNVPVRMIMDQGTVFTSR